MVSDVCRAVLHTTEVRCVMYGTPRIGLVRARVSMREAFVCCGQFRERGKWSCSTNKGGASVMDPG